MKKCIKILIIAGIYMVFINHTVWAEKMYITDILKLRLWDGKGSGHSVIKTIGSGDIVDVITKEDKWAQVRTSDGKEGWLQSRFLVSKMTHSRRLARLERKHKAMIIQNSVLLEENAKLKTENNNLQTELDRIEKTSSDLSESFESLKTESAGYVALKAKYDKISSQQNERVKKVKSLEAELEKYKTDDTIYKFLAGAGAVLLGLIIGLSVRRKRRKSLLVR